MKICFFLILTHLLLSACSGIKVTSDFNTSTDFISFKTYSYLGWSEESEKVINRLDKERIEHAFSNEFAKRGLIHVKEGGDLVVSLFIVVDQLNGTSTYNDYYGTSGSYKHNTPWGWGRGPGTTTYHSYDYLYGTLICDIFEGDSKILVWQGVGSGVINENPVKRERNIPKAVAQIMSEYPVAAIPKNKLQSADK